VRTGTIDVDGLGIFYREAGKLGNPKLVFLHGFPASSHQYRHLIPALAGKFHVIGMDYSGFGNSECRIRRSIITPSIRPPKWWRSS